MEIPLNQEGSEDIRIQTVNGFVNVAQKADGSVRVIVNANVIGAKVEVEKESDFCYVIDMKEGE